MSRIAELVIPAVASPVLLLVLRLGGMFELPALAHWSFPAATAAFVSAAVGSFAAFWRPRSRRNQVVRLLCMAAIFLFTLAVYDRIAGTAPSDEYLWLSDALGFVSFFACYLAFGFCVADISHFFVTNKSGAKKSDAGT